MRGILTSWWTKAVIFALSLAPAGALVWKYFHRRLGPNPIEFITHETGDWILIFLVITLAITPARKLLRLPELIRFRRMTGLFAFFYAFLHFSIWIGLDRFFDLAEMLHDVRKRPFITAGFTGFALLIPLALTSTRGWIRRLGGRRWQLLHRLVYISAVAGVVHYYWLVKSDVRKPLMYGAMVGLLLVFRVSAWLLNRRPDASAPTASKEGLTTAETS